MTSDNDLSAKVIELYKGYDGKEQPCGQPSCESQTLGYTRTISTSTQKHIFLTLAAAAPIDNIFDALCTHWLTYLLIYLLNYLTVVCCILQHLIRLKIRICLTQRREDILLLIDRAIRR